MLGYSKKDKNSTTTNEDIIYEYVLDEMEHKTPNKGILTKAVLESSGDDDKAKALYLKYRVESIEKDITALEIDIRKYSKEQLFSYIDQDFKNYKKSNFFKFMVYLLSSLIFVSLAILIYLYFPPKQFLKESSNVVANLQEELAPILKTKPDGIIDTYGNSYKEVVSPFTGKVWLDRNLGASKVCESFDDDKCFGSYFQWGRSADGHEKYKVEITTELASTSEPGHSDFIVGYAENRYDWISVQDNTLWKGIYASNNPCPKGFRIPTTGEFKKELIDHGGNNIHKGYKSFLKLPIAGYRNYSGVIDYQGFEGRYWTSSTKAQFALSLNTASNSGKPYIFFFERANGYSLRCIKDK